MKTGAVLKQVRINRDAGYSQITVTAAYAVDEYGRNIGVQVTVESEMLTSVVIEGDDGNEIYRSPVRRLRHSVLDAFPCSDGVTVRVRYLSTSAYTDLEYAPVTMAGGGAWYGSLMEWPWRYYWGPVCPVTIQQEEAMPWERVRGLGGAFIRLPECLPVISWHNAEDAKVSLAVFADESPADEWNPERCTVRKTYYTPPLLPEEVDSLRSLMMAAGDITISDTYAPARLEDMTVEANYGDGQQLIKLTFCYELR